MNKLIIKIDASSLVHSSCFRRFILQTVHGFRDRGESINLIFGSSVHKFNEIFLKENRNLAAGLAGAQEYFQERVKEAIPNLKYEYLDDFYLTRCCIALANSYKTVPGLNNIEVCSTKEYGPMVEQKFAIPLADSKLYAILLCGTFDLLAKINNGCSVIYDFKTSSNSNLKGYLSGYRLSTQLMTYYHSVVYHAEKYPNSVYAEMLRRQIGTRIIVIHTTGKDNEPQIIPSEVIYFKDDLYQEYKLELEKLVDHLKIAIEYYLEDPKLIPDRIGILNGSCQTYFGSDCPYFGCCTAPDSRSFWGMLEGNFIQEPYDPLKFRS